MLRRDRMLRAKHVWDNEALKWATRETWEVRAVYGSNDTARLCRGTRGDIWSIEHNDTQRAHEREHITNKTRIYISIRLIYIYTALLRIAWWHFATNDGNYGNHERSRMLLNAQHTQAIYMNMDDSTSNRYWWEIKMQRSEDTSLLVMRRWYTQVKQVDA